jgi:hypothetical protein
VRSAWPMTATMVSPPMSEPTTVWTHDIGSALRTAHAIGSGGVQVNQGLGHLATPTAVTSRAESDGNFH